MKKNPAEQGRFRWIRCIKERLGADQYGFGFISHGLWTK